MAATQEHSQNNNDYKRGLPSKRDVVYASLGILAALGGTGIVAHILSENAIKSEQVHPTPTPTEAIHTKPDFLVTERTEDEDCLVFFDESQGMYVDRAGHLVQQDQIPTSPNGMKYEPGYRHGGNVVDCVTKNGNNS